jgi:hypothetical protein
MNRLRKAFHCVTACVLLGACITMAATLLHAQQNEAPIAPPSMTGQAATPTWTPQQLITSTVHQAWVMSGRNEATFFEMVRTLAEISAANRGVTLPNTRAAGEQMGVYIKNTAKADTDQLLYDVVDKAVMMEAHESPTPAGTRSGSTDQR